MNPRRRCLLFFFVLCPLSFVLGIPALAADHPFILWNKQDIAELRRKVSAQPRAKDAYQKMLDDPVPQEVHLDNLFRYAVMGDAAAAESEKKILLETARSPVPRGAAQYINVVRYDQLYGLLSDSERRDVQRFFREYIDLHVFRRAVLDRGVFNPQANYQRYDAREYTRTNWLPNIIWPWKVSANLMALALQDEKLIRRTWSAYGSWQWYFDEYLGDIGFYSEDFSKMGSTPGAMLLFCRGCRRAGLDELGYGYQGRGGATMRGHIESLIHVTYPRVDLGSSRPQYPIVTMGDLRQMGSGRKYNLPGYAFQHSLVTGYMPDGFGGTPRWAQHGAWGGERRGKSPQWDIGKTPKMLAPFWFEIGHKNWPDAGFDYFLAQMRPPESDRYYPSIYFGLDPIDPRRATPPPAPSAVWPDRGLAMLRFEESPDYWQSDAPAVCLRLGSNYAHNVNDPFVLAGFFALNRPLYLNRQTCQSYAQGYSRSIQSHCGVTVDMAEPKFTSDTVLRSDFRDACKFVAARSNAVYEDVDLSRALFLTREYLLDITSLTCDRRRQYDWIVHAVGPLGLTQPGGWRPAGRIDGFSDMLTNVRRRDMNDSAPWSVTVVQECPLRDVSGTALGKSWYDKRIGVRMTMLAAPGTTAFTADTPQTEPAPRKPLPGPDEIGGTTIIARRLAERTSFVVLHEPIQKGQSRIEGVRSIAQSEKVVAVAVAGAPGSGINDRLLLALGDAAGEEMTVADGNESFTFTGQLYVRAGEKQVQVAGDVASLRIPVRGKPKLAVNGKPEAATFEDGALVFGQ